jgi:hypothetical protein
MARNFGGIAQGLATGIQLAESIQARKDNKERSDREYGLRLHEQNNRLDRQAKRDAREDAEYGVQVAEDDYKRATLDTTAALSKYKTFDAMPPDVQQQITDRATRAGSAREQARTKRSETVFGQPKNQQNYSEIISNLQTGRVQLEDVPPDQLWLAVTNATQRDPSDFMGSPDGGPSPISKAVGDLTTGLETGNNSMILSGANVLLAPELRRGVGTESPHGGKIVFKEIDRLIPHPGDPSKVTPVLKVYVDGGQGIQGPRGAHGETAYYLAPLTEGRTSDPNDPVKFLDMKAAMDRVGQLGMLTEVMGQPQFRQRMEEGRAQAGGRTRTLLDQMLAEAAAAMPKPKTTVHRLPADDGTTLIEQTDPVTGEVLNSRELKHAARPAREKTFEVKNAEIDEMLANGEITPEEARRMRAKNVSGIDLAKDPNATGRSGGRGGAGGAGGKVTEAEVKGTIKDAEKHIASSLGLQVHPVSKKWVGADGKPADPAKVEALNEAVRKAGVLIRDNQAAGKKTGLTPALEAAGATAPVATAKPAEDKFKVGTIYKNGKGQQAKYLGQGKWEEVK